MYCIALEGLKTKDCLNLPCPGDLVLPAEVTAWLSRLRMDISSVVRHSTHPRDASSNMSQLVRWAFRLYRKSPFKAMENDKETGLSLVERSDLQHCALSILTDTKQYEDANNENDEGMVRGRGVRI